jgi:hypothetical protein
MNPVFMIEFLGFDVAVVAWASYELWSVRRSKFPDDTEKKDVNPSKDSTRHPEG